MKTQGYRYRTDLQDVVAPKKLTIAVYVADKSSFFINLCTASRLVGDFLEFLGYLSHFLTDPSPLRT